MSTGKWICSGLVSVYLVTGSVEAQSRPKPASRVNVSSVPVAAKDREHVSSRQNVVRPVQYEAEAVPPRLPAATERPQLTLAGLEELAMQFNPTLSQASAGVEAERGSYTQAGLYPNPQLGYVNTSASPSSERQSNGVFISQEFVTANKLKLARAWEGHEVNRVGWEAEAQRFRVLNDLKTRYYELVGAQEAVFLTKRLEKLAEEGLANVEELFKAKQVSKLDVGQARIQLETMRMNKEEALARHAAAWDQLAVIVGDLNLPPSLVKGDLGSEIPELDMEQSWQKLQENSPQISSSQAALDHARAEWNLARAQAVPNLTLQTVIDYDRPSRSTTASTLVSFPVPFSNRNQGNIYRAQADICASEAEIQRVRLVLRDQLIEAFRRYHTSRRQVARLRDVILPITTENVEFTQSVFKAGETTFQQIVTARQANFEANLALIEAQIELRKVIVEIEGMHLSGGLNPAAVGGALQSQPGGGTARQRALLQRVQEGSSRQLLPAAQLGR